MGRQSKKPSRPRTLELLSPRLAAGLGILVGFAIGMVIGSMITLDQCVDAGVKVLSLDPTMKSDIIRGLLKLSANARLSIS